MWASMSDAYPPLRIYVAPHKKVLNSSPQLVGLLKKYLNTSSMNTCTEAIRTMIERTLLM
jgi:hypothetical protein